MASTLSLSVLKIFISINRQVCPLAI